MSDFIILSREELADILPGSAAYTVNRQGLFKYLRDDYIREEAARQVNKVSKAILRGYFKGRVTVRDKEIVVQPIKHYLIDRYTWGRIKNSIKLFIERIKYGSRSK